MSLKLFFLLLQVGCSALMFANIGVPYTNLYAIFGYIPVLLADV